MYICA